MRQVLHPRHRIRVQPDIIALLERGIPHPQILPESVPLEPILLLVPQHVVHVVLRQEATTAPMVLRLLLELPAQQDIVVLGAPWRQSSAPVEPILLVAQQYVPHALLDTTQQQLAHRVPRVLLRWATTVLKALQAPLELRVQRVHLVLGARQRQSSVLLEGMRRLVRHSVLHALLDTILLLGRRSVSNVLLDTILLVAQAPARHVLLLLVDTVPPVLLLRMELPAQLVHLALVVHQQQSSARLIRMLLLAPHSVLHALLRRILLLARHPVSLATRRHEQPHAV